MRSSDASAAAIAGPMITKVEFETADVSASNANRCTNGSRSVMSLRRISVSGDSGRLRPTAQAVRARTKPEPARVSSVAVWMSRPPNTSTRISIARSRSGIRRDSIKAASRKTSAPSAFARGNHVARDQLLLGCGAASTEFRFSEPRSVRTPGGVAGVSQTIRKTLPRVPRPPTLTNRFPSGATSISVGANPN